MYYPFLFEPNLHPVVWGGHQITQWKQLPPSDQPIGESWEVSAVPGSESVIANGNLAGHSIVDVVRENPAEILGRKVADNYDNELPLLVKFIDARRDLSIQVHPNDEMAHRLHQKRGKTEMWYILGAQPGAFLYAGFKDEITPEEYRQRIADGTITDVLARHEVHVGDVFFLPAGRVHAICSGILLAEVQQSSDVTYRIFDYNRPGMDGKLRQLHTDLAAEALDFHVEQSYRTDYNYSSDRANLVVDSKYFSVRVIDVNAPFHRNLLKYDSFIITMCLKGDCRIRVRCTGDEIRLREGFSTFIPASIADYDIIPDNASGKCQLLDAFINNKPQDLTHLLSRFLHITDR